MLGYIDLINRVSNALKTANSGVSVYVGEDASNTYGLEQAPYITILPSLTGADIGDMQAENTVTIDVYLGISSDTWTTSGNLKVQDGLAAMETFASSVYSTIVGSLNGNEKLNKVSYSLDGARLPLIESGFTIEILIYNAL